jgi:uncharacterized membrane protein
MRPTWVVIALIVSVALNLFLIGAAAGVFALGVSLARENARPRAGLYVRATRDLPESTGRDMRQMLRGVWAQAQGQVAASRQLRLEGWGSLADPKPDAATIKAKLAQSRQLDTTTRATVEERIVDYALTLPPAERDAFAAGMRRVLAQGQRPLAPTNATAPAKP